MTTHDIGEVDEFPPNRGTRVEVDGIEIAVFRIDDEFYGIQNRCPHKRLPLHVTGEERYMSGELIEDGFHGYDGEPKAPDQDIRGAIDEDELTIHCPWHYLEWDLETGENEVTKVCIATYEVDVEDGTVRVEI